MLNRLSFYSIVLMYIFSFSLPVVGAELLPSNSKGCEYVLVGELVSSDPDRIESIITASPFETLCLNSPGGSFLAGMKLADIFMNEGIQTYVKAGDECYSACAIAFLGGSIWGDLRHVSRTLETGGKLGFHAPFLALPKAQYKSEYVEGLFSNAIALTSFLTSQKVHLKINDSFLTEFAFYHNDDNAVNTVETVRDAAIVGLELSGYTKPKTLEASSYNNACSLLFNLYEDYFTDRVTASRPYFSLGSSDMERQIIDNAFEVNGERNIMVSTISDWELYTPTASCAFNPAPTWSSAVEVVMWSNGFNETPIYENADRKLEITIPDWYFLDAETSLVSLR
jgi:hypothetical protein